MKKNRRDFLSAISALGLGSALVPGWANASHAGAARVVVIGGGFGGATAAKYLKLFNSGLNVTLVEPNPYFYTCPFSNQVLGGLKKLEDIKHSYDDLKNRYHIKVVQATAKTIDGIKKEILLDNGERLIFDKAIVSPGIDFKFDEFGYNAKDVDVAPHAWKAGSQTVLLQKQLKAMRKGGVVAICPPANPFRCPPGPYERASMIAHYLKQNNPTAKILVLDRKNKFSKQKLFVDGWVSEYGEMIEWRSADTGGLISEIDAKKGVLETEFGEEKADVINYIPNQKAGAVATNSGLANDEGWCPVSSTTFESTLMPDVHVIGDAAIAGKMPKSGFSANSQAKVTALAITQLLAGQQPESPSFSNTCYSLIAPEYGISVAAVYRDQDGKISSIKGAGGVSPEQASIAFRAQEASYAQGWYDAITQDMFK